MKIVIDAGHGNSTAGKRVPNNGMREFEFNSVVADKLKEKLRMYVGVETLIVHDPTGRADILLATRVRKANDWKADCYVSIHANAYSDTFNDANGIETFVHNTKATAEERELAKVVQDELVKSTGLRNRGVKQADFQVLRDTNMTSVLAECGFMTNLAEAKLLQTDEYREKVATALEVALVKHYKLKRIETVTAKPVSNEPDGWAEVAWNYVFEKGYMDGKRPHDGITRQEVAVIIHRLLTKE